MPDHCVSVTGKWQGALVVWTMSGKRPSTRNGDLSIGNKLAVPVQLDFLDTMLVLYALVVLPMPVVVKRVKSESFSNKLLAKTY